MKTLWLSWVIGCAVALATAVRSSRRARTTAADQDHPDSDPARRAAAAEAARGERAGRRQPGAVVGQPRRQVRRSSWAASRTYLESVGLHAREHGPHRHLRRPLRTAPAARPARRGAAEPDPRRLLLAQALASGTSITDYDSLLPLIGGALGNISDEDLPIALQLAGVVGQLRRRRRDLRGEEPDRVRARAGRRGAVAAAGRHRAQRAVRQAARPVHRHLPAAAAAALRDGQRRPAWSTAAGRPTSSPRPTPTAPPPG